MIFNAAYDPKPKVTKGEGLKILTPKENASKIANLLAQVKAGNNSENLLKSDKLLINCINQIKLPKK